MKKILFGLLIISSFVLAQKDDKMVLLSVKSDPTITFRIWFKVGSQDDPKGKEGLAYLTSRLITEGGTEKLSYEQVIEELFPIAASISVSSSTEMTIVSGRTHIDNIDKYYNLFIQHILSPGFSEKEFNRLKAEQLNYIKTTLRYSSDEELGKAVLYNSIFEGTSYGHIPEGTISSVESITLNDVKNFYKKYFNRNNFIIGLGGNFDDALKTKIQNDMKKLPDGQENNAVKPSPKKIDGLNIVIVEKKANATAISMGFPINVLRGEDDWYPLALATSWFGEHRNSSSHLYQVIREKRGLNYGDYAYIEHFPGAGFSLQPPVNASRKQQIFEIWIRPVPNETRHFVLRAALREFDKLIANGLNDNDFGLTKNFLSKYILHFAPNTNRRLAYKLDDKFYGIKENHLEKYASKLKNMKHDDVNKVIKKHLQNENMVIVFITENGEELKESLVNNFESPITYSTPKSEDILNEDLNIINYKLKIEPSKVKIVRVEDLFN